MLKPGSTSVTEKQVQVGEQTPSLARRLGPFDATMIVMGGIIGSGIFMNPHVVAEYVHSPFLILGTWFVGGLIALGGAFVYAELSARRPLVGGSYAYLREAYHPVVAFMFAWSLLLVSDTGGMAAVAMTFARYFIQLTHIQLSETSIAISALGTLTVINCFGVRAGSNVQNTLMIVKIAAILLLITAGMYFAPQSHAGVASVSDQPVSLDLFTTFGAAMVPVLFAFGGWQTACFVAGEVKDPRKNLPRGLLLGVVGVILLYLAVNFVCVRVLGPAGLAASTTPASEVMRSAFGETGALIIAIGIAISTLGFLSQSILVAPRVYYAMANDGLFFKSVARIHPRTRVPILAIVIQGILASAITLSGKYEDILNYVVLDDFVFFALSASCIFIFRRRASENNPAEEAYNMPGHPYTTLLFILICCFVVVNTAYKFPTYGMLSIAVILAGIPVYYLWKLRSRFAGVKEPAQ